MSTIDILINKVQELTTIVNAIQSNSKKIPQLPEIEGDDIYLMGHKDGVTGKVRLLGQNDDEDLASFFEWKNVEFIPESSLVLSNRSTSFNLEFNSDQWGDLTPNLKGFKEDEPSDGLTGFIRNGSKEQLILKHNSRNTQDVSIPFYLSSGQDYLLMPNEILSFKYSKDRNRCEVSVYNSSLVPLRPVSEVYVLSEADLSGSGVISIDLKLEPSQLDFVNVFCNGVYLNPSGISVVDNYLLIDKKKVEYSFREGMKLTINYKS